MTQFRTSDTKLLALKEAVRQGRPDIAVDILSDRPTVRAYVRSASSPLGMQSNDEKPFPEGTKYIVIVDFGPDGNQKQFYVLPARTFKRAIDKGQTHKPRPVTPGSHHCYIAPEKHFGKYLGTAGWKRVPPLEIEGFRRDEGPYCGGAS